MKNFKERLDEIIIDLENDKYIEEKIVDFLREIYENEISDDELFYLTKKMVNSGETFKWDNNLMIDKHSTGGVGDKVTLIIMPVLANLGFKCAKMSGRSLGLTGGTADKLESIKDINIDLSKEEFVRNVEHTGISLMTQTDNIARADKIFYALRDKYSLTDSIPLIASSIMSKKIALGAKNLILDITCGSGAFMKTKYEAELLGKKMLAIGEKFGINVAILITNMEEPLGHTIGNRLEVLEAIRVLKGEKGRVRDLIIKMIIAFSDKFKNLEYINRLKIDKEKIEHILDNNIALEKFFEMLKKQGVKEEEIEKLLKESDEYILDSKYIDLFSNDDGIISKIDAKKAAELAFYSGAGKNHKDEDIQYNSGVIYYKLSGEFIKKGDLLARVYYKNGLDINKIEKMLYSSIILNNKDIKDNKEIKKNYKYIDIYNIF